MRFGVEATEALVSKHPRRSFGRIVNDERSDAGGISGVVKVAVRMWL
jgi:hypothetical protein